MGNHADRSSADSAVSTPTVSTAGDLTVRVDGELATVTLDRPAQLNAQTPHTWARLRAIGAQLDGSVRVVLVTATGRAFSAGLDRAVSSTVLTQVAHLDPDAGEALIEGYQAAFGWLARTDIVSIAAVQGHAVGAGFQLALACDIRLLADDAVLTMAEVPLGLVPDLGGTRRLVELVGYSRAMEICLTGRGVPAAEALSMGLASRVVPAEALGGAARDTADAILRAPRPAVIEAKALLRAAGRRSQAEQEAAERAAQHRLLRTRAGVARE